MFFFALIVVLYLCFVIQVYGFVEVLGCWIVCLDVVGCCLNMRVLWCRDLFACCGFWMGLFC